MNAALGTDVQFEFRFSVLPEESSSPKIGYDFNPTAGPYRDSLGFLGCKTQIGDSKCGLYCCPAFLNPQVQFVGDPQRGLHYISSTPSFTIIPLINISPSFGIFSYFLNHYRISYFLATIITFEYQSSFPLFTSTYYSYYSQCIFPIIFDFWQNFLDLY